MTPSNNSVKNDLHAVIINKDGLFCVTRNIDVANQIKNILRKNRIKVETRKEKTTKNQLSEECIQFIVSDPLDIHVFKKIKTKSKLMGEVFKDLFVKNGSYVSITKDCKELISRYLKWIEYVSRTIKREVIIKEPFDGYSPIRLTKKLQDQLEVFNGICTLLSRRIDYFDLDNTLMNLSTLKGDQIVPDCDPEAFTKYAVIEPLLTLLGFDNYCPELRTESGRKVDYAVPTLFKKMILIEAKGLGKDLFNRTGAKNQAKQYIDDALYESFAIATDGLRWVLVTKGNTKDVPTNMKLVDLRPLFLNIIFINRGITSELDKNSISLLKDFLNTFSKENIFDAESELSKTTMSQYDLSKIRKEGRKHIEQPVIDMD